MQKPENQPAIHNVKNAERKKDFSFKEKAGQIKIEKIKQKIRKARVSLEADPADKQAKSQLVKLIGLLKDTELKHYRLKVENYPTDLGAKYEYAVRLYQNKEYDDAIPLFQEAQRDPRYKITSMNKIGSCFYMKEWFADAIDVYQQAVNSYEIQDDGIAKELRYNLARAYESQGDAEKALDIYRRIAQLDFGYKDVRQRIDNLRKKPAEPTSQ